MEERRCSPTESLIISLKQVKDIKNGMIPRKTWEQLLEEEENTSLEYTINTTPKFDEDIKYYKRKKKYTNIFKDITPIIEKLKKGEFEGDIIPNLQLDTEQFTYKVRAVNTNANVGKSNGYRMLYYVIKNDREIFLLTIYSKKDNERIVSNNEIIKLVNTFVKKED